MLQKQVNPKHIITELQEVVNSQSQELIMRAAYIRQLEEQIEELTKHSVPKSEETL